MSFDSIEHCPVISLRCWRPVGSGILDAYPINEGGRYFFDNQGGIYYEFKSQKRGDIELVQFDGGYFGIIERDNVRILVNVPLVILLEMGFTFGINSFGHLTILEKEV